MFFGRVPSMREFFGVPPLAAVALLAVNDAYRKGRYGTFSETGSRFIERIMSVVQSCKAQSRSVHQFLTQTPEAHLRHLPPPSLVPEQSHVMPLAA
jgi:transposase